MRSGSDAIDYASHLTEINEVQEVAGLQPLFVRGLGNPSVKEATAA
jgi:hypothetical protein